MNELPESPQPVPVTILTGFLGAGKTTLLNNILRGDHGMRIGVIVNDFGAVNIDSQLVVGVESDTVSLSNGCICCTLRDDLLSTAMELIERPDAPEYIVVEASGVSDPVAIALTFLSPHLRLWVKLDSIITVVDSEHVRNMGEYQELVQDQIAAADIVLLNKVDLVGAEQVREIKVWIHRIAPRARILETVEARAPLELLLGIGKFELDPDRAAREEHIHVHAESNGQDEEHGEHGEHAPHPEHEHHHHEHDHALEFSSWCYQSDGWFDYDAVREVFKNLPNSIFRSKGFLRIAGLPEVRVVAQMVGRRSQVKLGETWGDQKPRNQIVFIGSHGGVNATELKALFDECLVSDKVANARYLERKQKEKQRA